MKTTSPYTILYDDACPMCTLASRQLVNSGMLGKDGRRPFSQAQECNLPNVDWNRGRNEVPVVNTTNQSVRYGIDGLLPIITRGSKWLEALLRFKPIWFVLRLGYRVIAYNRRAILPGRVFEGKDPIAPDLNITLRWTYIVLTWLITSIILTWYSTLLNDYIPPTNFIREFLICGGQIIFQGALLLLVRKDRCIHYLGNMMTISFAGSLLLLPILLVSSPIEIDIVFLMWFAAVVSLMFVEHLRRVKLLELPWFITAGWILYRILVLLIILYI